MIKGPERFIISLIILSAILAGIYYFIPKDRIGSEMVYKYVPKDADFVVGADLSNLYDQFKLDAISNPKSLLEFKNKDGYNSSFGSAFSDFPFSAMDTKEDVVLFKSNETIYYVFPISDREKIQNYLTSKTESLGLDIYYHSKSDMTIQDRESVLIFSSGMYIPDSVVFPNQSDSSWIDPNSFDGIYFIDKQSELLNDSRLKFNKNKIIIDLSLKSDANLSPNQEENNNMSIPRFRMKGNLIQNPIYNRFRSEDQYSVDSLLQKINVDLNELKNHWTGSFYIDWFGYDTVIVEYISFEYDDFFNKEEVIKTKDELIPKFEMALKGEGLYDYLKNKGLIQSQNGKEILAGAPFLINVFTSGNDVFFSTEKELSPNEVNFENEDLKINLSFKELKVLFSDNKEIVNFIAKHQDELKDAKISYTEANGQGKIKITLELLNNKKLASVFVLNHLKSLELKK